MNKSELRALARTTRGEIFDREKKTRLFDKRLINFLEKQAIENDNKKRLTVGMYVPINNEIELPLSYDNIQIALPVIRHKTTLEFYRWDKGEKLVKRDFDIPVPDTRGKDPVNPDIILSPLLLCDEQGNRLGNGAGHYDRYIDSLDTRPLYVAVCFDEQVYAETLPFEPHDQKLDLIITPSRIITIE